MLKSSEYYILSYLTIEERPLALDIQFLANRLVQLDILDPRRLLALIG